MSTEILLDGWWSLARKKTKKNIGFSFIFHFWLIHILPVLSGLLLKGCPPWWACLPAPLKPCVCESVQCFFLKKRGESKICELRKWENEEESTEIRKWWKQRISWESVENWVRLLVAVRVGECEMRVCYYCPGSLHYTTWLDLILMNESTRSKTRWMFLRRSNWGCRRLGLDFESRMLLILMKNRMTDSHANICSQWVWVGV